MINSTEILNIAGQPDAFSDLDADGLTRRTGELRDTSGSRSGKSCSRITADICKDNENQLELSFNAFKSGDALLKANRPSLRGCWKTHHA